VGVISGNVIEKGPNSPNRYVIHYGGEGTYAGSDLQVTNNTLVNNRGGSGATAVYVETRDGGANGVAPVTITGNAFYSLYPTSLLQDSQGTTPDVISGNTLIDGSGPTLDTSSPVCFAEGTRIAADRGDVAVEALLVGDQVVVLEAGERVLRPVRWIGERQIDLRRHPRRDVAAPVRILRSAFAEASPCRDLLVSPDHCLFVDGWLIPARLLINGMTITQDLAATAIRYFHIELDSHGVLLAEGLAAESYLDTGNRAFFDNAGLPVTLHPCFAIEARPRSWHQDACAKLAVGVDVVEPIWRALSDRARFLGHTPPTPEPTTDDPDLRLIAGGRPFHPVCAKEGVFRFTLPRGSACFRIRSRSVLPRAMAPYLDDRRRLGVAIERILLSSDQAVVEIPADDPLLTEGWHQSEREGMALWRWTDGDALVTVPPVLRDGVQVDLLVRASHRYPLDHPRQAERIAA
jgi:hypothetical protein